ncbi:MAG TPA: hypothetical protein VFZ34_30630 [Blastocatellia bacterium]|nr:hypothetical protein [Blastocatellia bacterium]
MILSRFFQSRRLLASVSLAVCLSILSVTIQAQKTPNVEKLVEFAKANYGLLLAQTNGVIKSNLKLINGDQVREGRSTLKFIRKPKLMEDLVILELDLPDTKFTMGFDGQKTWATNNGERTELSPELSDAFRSSYAHSYEALLRYKEDGSKLEYVDTKKIASYEIDTLDLIMAEGTRTRYEVSRRSGRVLYLEYESKPTTPDAKPVKYRLHFKDFKFVQNNTVVIPYTTVVYENGVIVEERTVIEVAFSGQLDEKIFKPDAPAEKVEEKKDPAPTKP